MQTEREIERKNEANKKRRQAVTVSAIKNRYSNCFFLRPKRWPFSSLFHFDLVVLHFFSTSLAPSQKNLRFWWIRMQRAQTKHREKSEHKTKFFNNQLPTGILKPEEKWEICWGVAVTAAALVVCQCGNSVGLGMIRKITVLFIYFTLLRLLCRFQFNSERLLIFTFWRAHHQLIFAWI